LEEIDELKSKIMVLQKKLEEEAKKDRLDKRAQEYQIQRNEYKKLVEQLEDRVKRLEAENKIKNKIVNILLTEYYEKLPSAQEVSEMYSLFQLIIIR